MFGNDDEATGSYSNWFGTRCGPSIPAGVTLASVEAELAKHLSEMGLGAPLLGDKEATAAEVWPKLTSHQGVLPAGDKEAVLSAMTATVVAAVTATKASKAAALPALLAASELQRQLAEEKEARASVEAAWEAERKASAGKEAELARLRSRLVELGLGQEPISGAGTLAPAGSP